MSRGKRLLRLARVVRSNVQAAFENIALWHERDISHSSAERIILADSTILVDYLLAKAIWLVDGMIVSEKRMSDNLRATKGLIFSGQVLLDLAAAGMTREAAYKLVQSHAMRCWSEDGDFEQTVRQDPGIAKYLSQEQLTSAFDVGRQLRNVDRIFSRVF